MDRARRRTLPRVRRSVGHLRARQCGGARRGAVRGARCSAHVRGAQRAGHGPRGRRLRQGLAAAPHDGVHDFDRPGRHQPRDRGRGRACQPPAAAAPARRCICEPRERSGAAAGRGLRRRARHGQRLPAARVALFRPHHAAGAAAERLLAGHAGAHGSGELRSRHPRALPGRAGRGVRLATQLLRGAIMDWAAPAARSARACAGCAGGARSAPAAADLRRRRVLFRGG